MSFPEQEVESLSLEDFVARTSRSLGNTVPGTEATMEAHEGIAAEEDCDHADGHQDEDVPEDGDDHPDEVQAFYSGTTQ